MSNKPVFLDNLGSATSSQKHPAYSNIEMSEIRPLVSTSRPTMGQTSRLVDVKSRSDSKGSSDKLAPRSSGSGDKLFSVSKNELMKILLIVAAVLTVSIVFIVLIVMLLRKKRQNPPSPTSIYVTVLTPSSFKVSWNPVNPESGLKSVRYLIYRNDGNTVSFTNFSEKVTVDGNNHLFQNLKPGTAQTVMIQTIFTWIDCEKLSSPSASVSTSLCDSYPQTPIPLDIVVPADPTIDPFQMTFMKPNDPVQFTGKLLFVDTTSVNPTYYTADETVYTCDSTICRIEINDPSVDLSKYNKVYSKIVASNVCGTSDIGVGFEDI